MVLQASFSKESGSIQNNEFYIEPFHGSLHGEMVLQIDGECVVYGSIQKLFENGSKMVLQIDGESVVYGSIQNLFEKGSIQHQKGFFYCYDVEPVT